MMIQKNAFIRKTGTGWQLTSTLLIVAALLVAGGCTRDPKAKAEKHFAQAQEYLRDDKSDEALIELRRALQLEPRMAKAHYEIAKINMAKGMAPAAHQALLQAVKFDPSHKDAQIMLADILVGFADPDTARDRAEFIAKTWPDDVRSQPKSICARAQRHPLANGSRKCSPLPRTTRAHSSTLPLCS